jgi:alkanesulfonate monooxygenase SsuD/methylene tetrahydromethanopterin reductase-like flavin-dependent oxidoreductase (luciferase family)
LTEIRIGLQGGGDQKRVAELEAMPIDSLWTGGHVASRNPSTEAMVSLCRLSAWAERVQLGTAILLLPLYSPAIIAKMIADLDRYTDGRLILGVGVGGEYPQEFRATQVPVTERGKRTNEMIPLIRRLWTAEEISHDGPFYPMQDVKIHPAPAQPGGPPIVISGRKEAAMKRAAVMGDGWLPYLYSSRRYAESVETIKKMAADNGRDLQGDGFEFYAYCFLNINADSDTAKLDAATTIGGNYQQDFRQMIDNVAVAGNPDEVLEKLKAFVDGGARHFVFSPMTRDPNGHEPIVDLLVKEIVTPLREYAASLP